MNAAVTIAALDVVDANERQLNALRWPRVLDALQLGATLEQLVEVMLDVETTDELADWLICWAAGQEIDGRMTADEVDALMELVHAAGGPAPVPAERGLPMRWVAVAEALAFHGATLDDVAAAAGLKVDEVTSGLRAWAGGLDIAEIVEGHRRVRVEGPVFAPAELTEAVPTRGLHRRRFLTPAELTGAVR